MLNTSYLSVFAHEDLKNSFMEITEEHTRDLKLVYHHKNISNGSILKSLTVYL